jgi:predicted secreted protein
LQGIAHPGNCPANESLQKLALLEHDKPGDAMTSFRPLLKAMPLLALLFATSATAAAAGDVMTIDLAAEASRPAANDLARATVFAEAAGATPSDLARRVNGLIADGLKTARGYGSIKHRAVARTPIPSTARAAGSKAGECARN